MLNSFSGVPLPARPKGLVIVWDMSVPGCKNVSPKATSFKAVIISYFQLNLPLVASLFTTELCLIIFLYCIEKSTVRRLYLRLCQPKVFARSRLNMG